MMNNTTEEVKDLDVNALGGLLLAHLLVMLPIFIGVFFIYRKEFKAFTESVILFFSCQHHSLRGSQNIHNTLFTVLLNNVLIAITTVMLAIEFFMSTCYPAFTCVGVFNAFTAWSLYRCFGIFLHLLCNLVSILYLCHPQHASKLRWVVIVVPLFISVFVPVYIFISKTATFGLGVIIFGLAVVITAYNRVPAPTPSADCQKSEFVYEAIRTLLFVYVPIFVLKCLMISSDNYGEPANKYFKQYVVILVGTGVYHFFMDAHFCVIMLRLTAEDEEEKDKEKEEEHQSRVNPVFDFSEN